MESYSLYGGDIVLEYSPGNHRYTAVIKGRRYHSVSVTRALEVLNKPALVPWAVNATLDYIRPAIAPGVEHAESYLETIYAQAKKESTRIKRAAADVGTDAHNILERFPEIVLPEEGLVRNCVDAGVAWLNAHAIEWTCKEKPIYSRRYRYSGRLDGIATVDGILSLIDWKSSKSVYPEYRLQTAAYVHAYEEEHPDTRIEQRILIRLGKDDGAFEPHIYPRQSLRKDFDAFVCALKVHRRLQEIEKESRHKKKTEEV